MKLPSSSSIESAYGLIQPYVHKTPLLTCKTLDNIASSSSEQGQGKAQPTIRFYFKCENLQRIGAFKARGAFHALIRLLEDRGEEEVKTKGVITHSSGIRLSPLNPLALVVWDRRQAGRQLTKNRKPCASPSPSSADPRRPRIHRDAED